MPDAAPREVIPFRERKQDIALWIFFLVNVTFVTYQADIEQLVIRDPDNFTYPIWPRPFMVDFLHWYFENYDPLLYERPVWYTTIVWIDQVVYGPFYRLERRFRVGGVPGVGYGPRVGLQRFCGL